MELDYDMEPIAFLEGGKGLNDTEDFIYKKCLRRNIEVWKIDDLYENPRRLVALQFLEPKTIILGTTGVYRDKLDDLIELFFTLKLKGLENIVICMDSSGVLEDQFSKLPKEIKILEPTERYSIFNEDSDPVEFKEIER